MSALAVFLSSAILASCPASHVHYRPYPGVDRGLGAVPWIATSNGAFYGHLFYVGGTPWRQSKPAGAHIFTTVVHRNVNPKVLWIAQRKGAAPALVVRGRRLDAPGSFVGHAETVGAKQFPSYVEVPAAGCWRVTIRAGSVSGSVVFAAVDRF